MHKTKSNLVNLKQYIVVSEYNCIGYIIDSFDDIEEAKSLLNDLVAVHCPTKDRLYEQQMGFLSYRVHPTAVYACGNFINQSTNGSYSVMIFSTQDNPKFIESLIFERGNTIYAIDIADVREENKFINDYHPDLIAN